jgi:hypothetical protein
MHDDSGPTTALQTVEPSDITRADPEQARSAVEHVLATGDYSQLTNAQRAAIVLETCARYGVDPLFRPFDWIEFYDPETKLKKLTLYPKATLTDLLSRSHRIRIRTVEEKMVGSLFKVVLEGTMPDGRTETNVAYLDMADRDGHPLRGQRYGNALMKARTKAKRRLVFGMLGGAPPDFESLPQARVVVVDGSGAVIREPTDQDRALADDPRLQKAINAPTYELTAATVTEPLLPGTAARPHWQTDPEPPKEPYRPPARFHCDKKQWLGVWHMLVRDTFLADDEARHDFVGWYTSTWPEHRQTSSLSTFLDHATDRQAEALVNRARETLAERASFAPAPTEDAATDDEVVRDYPPTGVPVEERDGVMYPDRPLDDVEYNTAALRSFYGAWADALRHRDTGFRPMADTALARSTREQLLHEIRSLIGQVESVDSFLAMADDDDSLDDESLAATDTEPPF